MVKTWEINVSLIITNLFNCFHQCTNDFMHIYIYPKSKLEIPNASKGSSFQLEIQKIEKHSISSENYNNVNDYLSIIIFICSYL